MSWSLRAVALIVAAVCVVGLYPPLQGISWAEDLPIDVGAVGEQGRDDGPTVGVNVELFTDEADQVSQSMVESDRSKRHDVIAGLFGRVGEGGAEDVRGLVLAEGSGLFTEPVWWDEGSAPDKVTSLSAWLIVALFCLCGGGGFLLARGLTTREKGLKTGVR